MEAVKHAAEKVSSHLPGHHAHGQETILISGASGFVAAHVLNAFLEHGYNVRGTVRSEETAAKVRKTHAKYANQLSFAIVKDVAAPGAFDEAVKGVDGVIHTASPFVMSVEDNERDLLNPAIKGTTQILTAIQKNNPKVKRVVVTSSFAAIMDLNQGARPGYTYSEKDWNPITYDIAKSTDNGAVAYCASKLFAEKAAYDYVKEHVPNFSVSTLCPPMIYGPNLHSVSDLSKLNTSSADIYRLMNGSTKEVPETGFPAFCDVRNVGEAHLKAYESPKAAGQRYFMTAGNFSYQQVCDIIRAEFPELRSRTPEGTPNAPLPDSFKVDNSKAREQLGIHFIPLKECIVDTVKSLVALEKELGVN